MVKKCAAAAHLWRERGKIAIFFLAEFLKNMNMQKIATYVAWMCNSCTFFRLKCGINVRNLYTLTIISISRAKSCKISIASNFPMRINHWNYNSAFPVYLTRSFCNSLRKIRNEIITLNNKINLFGCMLFDFMNKAAVIMVHYDLCFIW